MKIALVVMPWVDIEISPLGIASLKAVLKSRGHPADCLYLNVRLAQRLGGLSAAMTECTRYVWPEYLFGYHLFGPGGTGELTNEIGALEKYPTFREVLERLRLSAAGLEALINGELAEFLDECERGIDWTRYDAVGFSSLMASHTACLALARRLKARYPDKPIIFGNSNVEGQMGTATLKGCEWVDYVVDGEAEIALPALLDNIAAGKPYAAVPRVGWRRGETVVAADSSAAPAVNLEELPFPEHDDYAAAIARAPLSHWIKPRYTFELSRGCWWGAKQHCTFCGLNGASMAYRSKSPARAARELVEIHRRYQALEMTACDTIMGIEHLEKVLPALAQARRESGADWAVYFDVKANLTAAQVRTLADAGMTQLQPGIESLSTPILKLMRKGIRAIHNIQALKFMTADGIHPYWFFLFGFPHEDPREFEVMRELALSLTHLIPPTNLFPVRPDRFSPYRETPAAFGIKAPVPLQAYLEIFPAARFRADEIAYFFEFDRSDETSDPNVYTAPLRQAVQFWHRILNSNFFAYRQGLGFIELYDSRPLRVGGVPEYREERLEGDRALVFRLLHEMSTFGTLATACRRELPEMTDSRIKEILGEFAERRWAVSEDGIHLNLAVPIACLVDRQRSAFEDLRALQKIMFRERALAREKEHAGA